MGRCTRCGGTMVAEEHEADLECGREVCLKCVACGREPKRVKHFVTVQQTANPETRQPSLWHRDGQKEIAEWTGGPGKLLIVCELCGASYVDTCVSTTCPECRRALNVLAWNADDQAANRKHGAAAKRAH